jgi:hypothetical protein
MMPLALQASFYAEKQMCAAICVSSEIERYFVAFFFKKKMPSVEDGVPGLGSTHAGNDKFCIDSDMYEKI